MSDFNPEIIYSYTRAQAIADGVLIDVTSQAQEAGFKIPVAISAALYHEYIVPPEGTEESEGQSLEDRLHDAFWMLKAAASTRWDKDHVSFRVLFLTKAVPRTLSEVECWAIVGPDDDGRPCLTIMLPSDY